MTLVGDHIQASSNRGVSFPKCASMKMLKFSGTFFSVDKANLRLLCMPQQVSPKAKRLHGKPDGRPSHTNRPGSIWSGKPNWCFVTASILSRFEMQLRSRYPKLSRMSPYLVLVSSGARPNNAPLRDLSGSCSRVHRPGVRKTCFSGVRS